MTKKKATKKRPRRRRRDGLTVDGLRLIPPEGWHPDDALLRELVFICVHPGGGCEGFDVQLTRVPSIGEEISREEKSFRVTRVQHEPVGYDGRARLGWHAFVDVEIVPEPEPEPKPRKRSTHKPKG